MHIKTYILSFLFLGLAASASAQKQALTQEEKQALDFLYTYMAQADKVDHDEAYYIDNVRLALQARREMPWGAKIPDREWRHFVLPIRVNNEDLDNSRAVFYKELAPRVKGMSMYDAALEVNHWCHEHVTYEPSDGRTSSPLATIRTSKGRCGEESTLTVAALRSVGIPARQVYTPRWAHTDDNHAWVEAWVDGKWYFMGACEPEPVLNLGWFNAPASRGMLKHTKVFGKYDGPEEVMRRMPRNTEINVIDHYAPSTRLNVQVVDANGKPVPNAIVEYKLYNYAEFYTVGTKQADKDGRSFLSAGLGDMLIWASKDGKFGFSKASFGKDSLITVALSLDANSLPREGIDIDIVPPKEHANIPPVTAEQRATNDKRFAYEDSLRQAYMATFMNEQQAREWATQHGYDADALAPLLVATKGNHDAVCHFLANCKKNEHEAAVDLLKSLSQKDLRDVTEPVLRDHLLIYQPEWESAYGISKQTFDDYVRCPRISNELLTSFRSFLLPQVTREILGKEYTMDDFVKGRVFPLFQKNPQQLVKFVDKYVTIDDSCNFGAAPISPIGVWKGKKADPHSRDIFFVALARSVGVPARIDPVTGKVQLMGGKQPQDVYFGGSGPVTPVMGFLKATYQPTKILDNPKYYNHFTLSKLTDSGKLQLLNYEEGEVDMGGGTTFNNLLLKGTDVEAGSYLMVSGTRLANGGVLAHMQFFKVAPHDTTTTQLVMRQSENDVQVIGSFDSESRYIEPTKNKEVSILSTTGRGYFIVAVLGVGQEPTNHALRDISAVKQQFEKWGQKMVFLFTDRDQYNQYMSRNEFKSLPNTVRYGIDQDGKILSQIRREMKLDASTLPVFIIADTFNRVVFVSQGYTIGLGEQMMNVINKLQ
ncbi:MAG: transglutaminase-like domain-containing protein [Prevotella sp.]|jgi:transglutaminase-like putative cysteine protease